ncbi:hypothetical protein GCM10009093_21530 [Brevundimonas terrae]|uniref:Uncharacterized protein n=1 Tax=Brevundimonas terrae TaxID=363631 RepID=A0ABN0YGB9_9CAUL|nr:hypothetical protein [Brevundimonas terrae]NIJ26899.1 hypothetical protein [Brevundimonas terrae]
MSRLLKLSIPEMKALTAEVERMLLAARIAAGPINAPGYQARRHGVQQALTDDLVTRLNACVSSKFDGHKVTLAGITSSSSGSIEGALTNWLLNARARMIAA